jgi:deoxyribodipyrimidine photo-lyase
MHIFLFRRDFRIFDNTGLNHAASLGEVLPVFILNPDQLVNNEYRSHAAINFMLQSLLDLNVYLKKRDSNLCLLDGDMIEELEKLIVATGGKIKSITINKDYTPFSRLRDKKLMEFCKKHNIDFYEKTDLILLENLDQMISQKFTPFYNRYKNSKMREPTPEFHGKFCRIEYGLDLEHLKKYFTAGLVHQKGGRKLALENLARAQKSLANYDSMHNVLTYSTSRLSPYLKFGAVSIREVYWAMKKVNKDYIRQLFWRDFYYIHAEHDPNCLTAPFREVKYKWRTDAKAREDFQNWCQGKTGQPLIDACMHQLNTTHYMHNRGRLIVADYLIKHLHIPWQWGEKYFAQKLVDYDPLINNYNWQFMSGTGPAFTPTFRVMSPERQQKLNDPDGEYIKKYS